MTGKTHLAGGFAAGTGLYAAAGSIPGLEGVLPVSVSIVGVPVPMLVLGTAVSMVAALLPDIDEPESLISHAPDAVRKQLGKGRKGADRSARRSAGMLLRLLQVVFTSLAWLVRLFAGGHRGATHMLLIGAGLSAGMYFLGDAIGFASLWLWFAVGYGSHLFLDMMTPSGLELLWPVVRRPLRLLPRPLCITTGTAGDSVIRVLLLAAGAWFLYTAFSTIA